MPEGIPSVEDILTGGRLPETEDEMSVARLAAALRAPGRPDELRHATTTSAAFFAARAQVAPAAAPIELSSRRSSRPAALAVAAVAGTIASVLFVGAAAAALTGSLPDPLQRVAHDLIGVPVPGVDTSTAVSSGTGTRSSSSSSSRGPAATPGAAALVGLCRAFGTRASDAPATGSTAYRALEAAAAARGQSVTDYCRDVVTAAEDTAGPSAKPTPPGQSNRPVVPPGQTKKPTAAPGQSNRPVVPPGQTKKPTAAPGQSNRPVVPPGQTKKPTAPPGQTKKPSQSPG